MKVVCIKRIPVFNINCDRFNPGHFSIDKPYEIKKIYYNGGDNFFGSDNVHQYIIIHGHGIAPSAIDYIQTRRINNLNKLV